MQVPRPSHGNIPFPNMPNVRVGNYASEEHFGGNQARQNQQLARAVGGAGDAVFNEALTRQKRHNESVATDLNNQMRIDFEEAKKTLFAAKGRDAKNTPEQVERWFDDFRTKHQGAIENRAQEEMFGGSLQAYRTNALTKAVQYRDEQELAYQEQTSLTQIEVAEREAADVVVGEGGIEAVLGKPGIGSSYITIIEHDTDKLTEGMPEETRKLARQDAVRKFHTRNLNALQATNPGKALEYLQDERVKDALGPAVVAVLKKKSQLAALSDAEKEIIDRYAQEGLRRVEAGEDASEVYRSMLMDPNISGEHADKAFARVNRMTELEHREEARRESSLAKEEKAADKKAIREQRAALRDNVAGKIAGGESIEDLEVKILSDPDLAEEVRKSAADLFRAADRQQKSRKVNEDLGRDAALDAELKEAGFYAPDMKSFNELSTEEQNKWLERGNARVAKAKTKTDPNLSLYLNLNAMTDEDLVTRWGDEDVRDADLSALGGFDSQWGKEQLKRVTDMQAGGGGKKSGKSPEMAQLDGELNTMARDIRLNIADTGASLSKDAKELHVDRTLNDYNKKLTSYMEEKGLEKVTQVPIKERERMQGEALITYYTQDHNSAWYNPFSWLRTGDPMTAAEARAKGVSISGKPIVPGSLSIRMRDNYIGGDVFSRNDRFINEHIPLSQVPEEVRKIAMETSGWVSRDLDSGRYIITPYDATGTQTIMDSDGITIRGQKAWKDPAAEDRLANISEHDDSRRAIDKQIQAMEQESTLGYRYGYGVTGY